MLDRLELFNFKSYRGHRTIGPFKPFTCVIGPNGAGKSNIFDAISFVLGVRSAQLRSSQLKDLIYRGASKRPSKQRAAADPNGEPLMDVDGETSYDETDVDDLDDEPGPSTRKAWVVAVYIDQKQNQWKYQRIITLAGASEYRINGKTVTYAKYNESLERHNILVKARNFLVFQGDVETVAQQNAKQLTHLFEQISGSLELKQEFEDAKAALEKATEANAIHFSKRKGISSEIKQFREQKEELKNFERIRKERDDAIIREILFKVYHIERRRKQRRTDIERSTELAEELRREQDANEALLKTARKEQVNAQKAVTKYEKRIKEKHKEVEAKRPDLLAIETQIAHTTKKVSALQQKQVAVQRDRDERASILQNLHRDLADTEKAVKQMKDEHRKASKARGLALSEQDLAEYRRLRAQAVSVAVNERQTVESLDRDARKLGDILASLEDKLEIARFKKSKRSTEHSEISERVKKNETNTKQLERDLVKAKKALAAAQQERTQQKQSELDDKLREVVTKLLQLNADQRENEREVRLKEAIEVLKRTIPGVYGRVGDLYQATIQKYSIAMVTVFGRNFDAVVVDTEETALQCIQSMRDQRSGTATFIPLDTIQCKPVDDRLRSLKGAHLAVDLVKNATRYEKALQYVCGSTIVCDDLETARSICYDHRTEVKAVTLDGTVIHKSGQMSGGSTSSSRVLGSNETEGLRKHEENLRMRLAEHVKSRPRTDRDEDHLNRITRIETELSMVRDDLSASQTRFDGCSNELKHVEKEIEKHVFQRDKASKELKTIERRIQAAQAIIDREELAIFSDFCARIGVSTIKVYEEEQLRFAEEEGSSSLKADKTLAKLKHQTAFETEQLKGHENHLVALQESTKSNEDSLSSLQEQRTSLDSQINELAAKIQQLIIQKGTLDEALTASDTEIERLRKIHGKSSLAFQKAQKDISSWNDEIERYSADRFAIFRSCRLEEIAIPLTRGSLKSVPLEMEGPTDMEIDTEQESRALDEVPELDIEVNYHALDEEDQRESSEEREKDLIEVVNKLNAELQRMAPNMKSIEKLDEVQAKLDATDKDHQQMRRDAKAARERFDEVRNKRRDLFMAAYDHISAGIDEVYKQLTRIELSKGKLVPGGRAYLTLEDDDDPYLHGIRYHALPLGKAFHDMEQLSGGEKTMAALALLFAVHSFRPSPFFVLDEVDAALDNTNVGRVARHIRAKASERFQFIVISLKGAFYDKSQGLIGVWTNAEAHSSDILTLDLEQYA